MESTESNKPPQIIHVAIDVANPASPINDLFKSFVRACADEILSDLKQNQNESKVELVTRSEASKILRVCPDTISSYEQKGLLKNYSSSPRKKLYALHELNSSGVGKYKQVS
jgi:hypothetical protein